MKHTALLAAMILTTMGAWAQPKVEMLVDVEGVHRNTEVDLQPGVSFQPQFDNGGGIGAGVNWYFSSRVSLELKVAALATDARLRTVGSDFVATLDLGYAEIYPIMAVVQWHPFEQGAIRPYFGAGVTHVILRNFEQRGAAPEVEFEDPTGLLLNAGIRVPLSKRWSLLGDARYVPVEAKGGVRFGSDPVESDLNVRPLVVGFGLAYSF